MIKKQKRYKIKWYKKNRKTGVWSLFQVLTKPNGYTRGQASTWVKRYKARDRRLGWDNYKYKIVIDRGIK